MAVHIDTECELLTFRQCYLKFDISVDLYKTTQYCF